MTMADLKCDVCGVGKAVGVCSTIMPFSCAYCIECLQRGAQPEIVFLGMYMDIGRDLSKLAEGVADSMVTYDDGRYVSYREWVRDFDGDGL